jgi:hypothetical protein
MDTFLSTLDLGQLGQALGAVVMAWMFLRFLDRDRKAFMDVIRANTEAQLAISDALNTLRQHCNNLDRIAKTQ